MKQKTVFRCSVKQGKTWVASPDYASFDEMMQVLAPWLKEHCNYQQVSFFTEQRWVQEDKA